MNNEHIKKTTQAQETIIRLQYTRTEEKLK